MIQEITAQGRNVDDMNVKAEMHTQHALTSVRRGNRGRNGVKLHQYLVKSIWLCSIDLDIWPHWSNFLSLSWERSSYKFLSFLTRQLTIFKHIEIPAWCKSRHIWCREGKGLTKVMLPCKSTSSVKFYQLFQLSPSYILLCDSPKSPEPGLIWQCQHSLL